MAYKQKRRFPRQHGVKPAGPITPSPLKTATQIAQIHGLTSGSMVLSVESKTKFELLLQAYLRKFLPQDAVEMGFVNEMVAARWRQQRIWDIQTAALDHQINLLNEKSDTFEDLARHTRVAVAFNTLVTKQDGLKLMVRYENAYSRMHDRAMKGLHLLREESNLRNDADSPELDEPVSLQAPPPSSTEPQTEPTTPDVWVRQLMEIYEKDKSRNPGGPGNTEL